MRCDMVMHDEFWQHMRHVVVYHIVLLLYCHFAPFLQIVWTTFKSCHGEIATWLHQPKQTKSEHKKTSIMNSYAESKSVISCLAFPSSGCLLLTLHPLRVDGVFSAFSFLFIYLFDSLYLVFTHTFYLPVCSCMGFTTHVCLISASCFLSLHFSPLPWLSLWTLWVSELFGTTRGRASDDHRTICSSASSYIIPLMYQLLFCCLLCFVFRGDTLRWGVPSFFT